jgi:glycosyltransferase involved in cell wall biosynthesis
MDLSCPAVQKDCITERVFARQNSWATTSNPAKKMKNEDSSTAGAVIEFHPEAFSVRGKKLMGRNSAGDGFLEAHFRYSTDSKHSILVQDQAHAATFAHLARNAGSAKPVHVYTNASIQKFAEVGTIFSSAPGLAQHAFQRSLHGSRRWSICGLTHTLLSDRVMDAIAAMVSGPVEEWDALVCTSSAACSVVEAVMEAERERLRERLGAVKFSKPFLDKIPLGVHCDRFDSSQDKKNEARRRLGISTDEIVVLFVGRLSFHAKAHPAAMDMAVANAAGNRKVVIVEYGIFTNPQIQQAFEDTARLLAPGIRRIVLDGANHDLGQDAWACADIFCSLSDNHQETFGLTPIEAMAAGLPVVVSDWNGYRDTVRDGIDGFRVRTMAPNSDFGSELARQYAQGVLNYDRYCGIASQFVAVDIEEATNSFEALFSSPEMRRRMGEAGRDRAKSEFDWAVIYLRYEKLWKELADRRKSAAGLPEPSHPWPARTNPFTVFASYPTHLIGSTSRIFRSVRGHAEHIESCRRLASFSQVADILPPTATIVQVLEKIPESGIPLSALEQMLPPNFASILIPTLAWCAKIGAVRIA